ncbi:MAG: hypothetical protein RSC60_05595 [Christensenellaceae bacterium]
MKLSDFFKQNIINDGEFETLGKLASRPDCSMLTFLNSAKYLPALYDNPAVSCIICTQEVADMLAPEKPYGIVISSAPQADFYSLHNSLVYNAEYVGAKFDTVIGKNCTISPLACIAPQNVKIGDNSWAYYWYGLFLRHLVSVISKNCRRI